MHFQQVIAYSSPSAHTIKVAVGRAARIDSHKPFRSRSPSSRMGLRHCLHRVSGQPGPGPCGRGLLRGVRWHECALPPDPRPVRVSQFANPDTLATQGLDRSAHSFPRCPSRSSDARPRASPPLARSASPTPTQRCAGRPCGPRERENQDANPMASWLRIVRVSS